MVGDEEVKTLLSDPELAPKYLWRTDVLSPHFLFLFLFLKHSSPPANQSQVCVRCQVLAELLTHDFGFN
ncbi:hypothetical protein NHX12_033583 [Muraenolepis orangiensis]|uniref:Uncharacterized protein n=1 Tax=Muraenolepis orangiensis TaxID=630683 RepID=A0A9Q0E7Y2_9TELE|nr:hypothetical protein NHX12_033583 [Muraenolepis orangiensis]